MSNPDELLIPAVVAKENHFSESTLAKWRVMGLGPPFLKLGHKLVRYRRCDVDAWKAARLRKSTSDPGTGHAA